MKKTTILLLTLISAAHLWGQQLNQNIRGTVTDRQSETPLAGATVVLVGSDPVMGTYTDENGFFTLAGVPVGRQALQVSYLGYKSITLPNILVTAGKEVVLDVSLEESVIAAGEVVITGETPKDQAINELATVSARTFSLEEVTRYSGARNDVARMVSNFAGVSTADDSRNDIVIRGNSPTGVLWRLEGIPIVNPNHFATLGTTGGPVSAVNTNLLKNSDFLTGAFPAEYGNANAGVFDLSFRSGNKDNHEFTAQLAAFSGLELMAEGPINRERRASYLVSYRYSFVGIGDALGIPIGTNAVPNYSDLSFKIDLGQSKAGNFSLFGIGGNSTIDFYGSELDENDLFADPNVDAFPRSRIGVIGLRHNLLVGKAAYLRTVVAASHLRSLYSEDSFLDNGEKIRVTEARDINNRFSVSSYLNKKFNARLTARAGILAEIYQLDLQVDDRINTPDRDGDGLPDWEIVRDFEGAMSLLQAYAQAKYKLSEQWTLNVGLHGQYLDHNGQFVAEPRAAVSWQLKPNQRLSLAYGLHSQTQPLPVYFYREPVDNGIFEATNEDLKFTQSQHLVLGYDLRLGTQWRVKAEAYYQDLNKVPVQPFPSSFSMLNAGADFVFPLEGSLENEGTGSNYGVELTLEKFFSRGYYGLLTTSVYDSEYTGSDGVTRNTAFNNQYVVNVLGGKEWRIGKQKQHALTFDMKLTSSGGRYFTPVDLAASRLAGDEVLFEDQAYSQQYDPYFRLDTKFGIRLNSTKKKFSQQFFIDFQNLTNNQNIFVQRYNDLTGEVNNVYQAGFFPDIFYRIQF